MNKSSRTRYVVSAILISSAVLAGCSCSRSSSSSSRGDDEDRQSAQQLDKNYPEKLLQLNEAHEKKLISDQDYQKQREKIIKQMNK